MPNSARILEIRPPTMHRRAPYFQEISRIGHSTANIKHDYYLVLRQLSGCKFFIKTVARAYLCIVKAPHLQGNKASTLVQIANLVSEVRALALKN